jgi:hypothetical protein
MIIMKFLIPLSLVAMCTLTACGNTQDIPPLTADNSIVQAENHNGNNDYQVREITRRLREVEYRYISKLSSYDREQATRELNQVYYLLDQLNHGNPNPNPNPGGYPMSDSDFSVFVSKVQGQTFDSDKITFIQTAVRSNWFTVAQITQIIKIFNFDDKKLDVLSSMYPKCTDKNNGYLVLDLFTFSSSKEKARQILEANPSPTNQSNPVTNQVKPPNMAPASPVNTNQVKPPNMAPSNPVTTDTKTSAKK